MTNCLGITRIGQRNISSFWGKGVFPVHLHEHYLRLRGCVQALEQEVVTLTLQEAAEHLCCTERHASLLLKQMQEAGWLRWQPGRGRGRRSQAVFALPVEEAALLAAQEVFSKGEAQAAFRLAESFGAQVQSRFLTWIAGQFGHRVETAAAGEVDVLRMPYPRMEVRLDPGKIRTTADAHLIGQVFDTLVRFDRESRTLQPQLAHAWEVSEDRTAYTFYLRKGVWFHHGRLLTAQDVKETLERLLDLQTGSSLLPFLPIREMRVLRDHVVEVVLAEPHPFFLHALSRKEASIVPCERVRESEKQFAHFPCGTGPFQVVKKDASQMVLQAFDRYFLGRPQVDRVEFWFGMERAQLQEVAVPGAETAEKEWPNVTGTLPSTSVLICNLRKEGPLQKRAFRERLDALLDREALVRELGGRREQVASGFLPEGVLGSLGVGIERSGFGRVSSLSATETPATVPEPERHVQKPSPAQAERMQVAAEQSVRHAGESPSPPPLFPEKAALRLHIFEWPENAEEAEWIRARCAAAGVTVEVRVYPIHEFSAHHHEADLILVSWQLADDIEFTLFNYYQPGRVPHRFLTDELQAEVESRTEALKREPDRTRRLEQLVGIERMLREERVMLFLYHYRLRSSYNPALGGATLSTLALLDFRHLWFKVK